MNSKPHYLSRYKDAALQLTKRREWKRANPGVIRRSNIKSDLKAKQDALGNYGKNGNAVCCWDGCEIDDLDMLTLDHVENNGAEHRKEPGMTGLNIYRKLRALGWPIGFQTLCWNHQWKKELVRRRDEAVTPDE